MGLVAQPIGNFWQPDWLDWIPGEKVLNVDPGRGAGGEVVLCFFAHGPGSLSELHYKRDRNVGGYRLVALQDETGTRAWTFAEVDAQSTDRVVRAGGPLIQCEKLPQADILNLYVRHRPEFAPSKGIARHWVTTPEGYWETLDNVYEWMEWHPATRGGVIAGWMEPPHE